MNLSLYTAECGCHRRTGSHDKGTRRVGNPNNFSVMICHFSTG